MERITLKFLKILLYSFRDLFLQFISIFTFLLPLFNYYIFCKMAELIYNFMLTEAFMIDSAKSLIYHSNR